jgi:hypothetical protein
MNQDSKKRLMQLAKMSGNDILSEAMSRNARKATIICSEGSVRLQTGYFTTPKSIHGYKKEENLALSDC